MNHKLFYKFFLFCLLLSLSTASAASTANASCTASTSSTPSHSSEIIAKLENLPVTHKILMREFLKKKGNNDVYLLTLQDGTKAVFKARNDLDIAYAEVAAFKASQFLGFPNVPPTVLRKIEGKWGALQLYIEPHVDSTKPEVLLSVLHSISKEDMANLKLFYFIFGQWDIGGHNIILQKSQDKILDKTQDKINIFSIDNSAIIYHQQVKYGKLPFIQLWHSRLLQDDSRKDNDISFPFHHVRSFLGIYPYVIYKNGLWVQLKTHHSNYIRAYTDYYPKETIEAIKKLDYRSLENIFKEAKENNAKFLNKEEDYFNAILDRRDQVLNHALQR